MPLLTVTGRDVFFAHWPIPVEALARRLPAPLTPATFDGAAWVSVLALENRSVGVGSGERLSSDAFAGTPQLNLRTYVTPAGDGSRDVGGTGGGVVADGHADEDAVEDDVGVYFLSLDTGRRTAAAAGRRVFGLPFHYADMSLSRRGDRVTFQSHRRGRGTPSAVFQARYRPDGSTFEAEPGTLEAFCVEQFRYYFPAVEDHRVGVSRGDSGGVRVGTIDRVPWVLRPVDATVRENTLFEAAGLPTPTADPVVHYSPGFEMGVEPIETRDGPRRGR
jgi:hypothetical protein